MKKLLLTAIAGSLLCGSAMAEAWLAIGQSDGGREFDFVDLETASCEGKVCSGWAGAVNINPKKNYDTLLSYYEFDCKKRKYRILALVKYLRQKHVGSNHYDGKWDPVVPSSISDGNMQYICAMKKVTDNDLVLPKPLPEMAPTIQDIMRKTLKSDI